MTEGMEGPEKEKGPCPNDPPSARFMFSEMAYAVAAANPSLTVRQLITLHQAVR